MSYCVTPGCYQPQNTSSDLACQSCGGKLLLRDRYRALKPLGRGGFGRTFLGIDEDIPSKPVCVIKQLCLYQPKAHSYTKAVQLFQQEAVRLDDLGKHPQIPGLLAHFEQNRVLYLVQEFIDGQTLEQEAAQQGAYSEFQIWEILKDLLPTLQYIHDRQIVHRDIKPANIMRRSSDRKLVLIDFGIAKLLPEMTLSQTGTVIGSPEYMAPEQSRGKAVPASDLYSLGVICIRLLTNHSPFDLFDVEKDCWVWRDRLPTPATINRRLGRILDTLLQSALSQRYSSAAAVLHDLERRPGITTRQPPTQSPVVATPGVAPTQPPIPRTSPQLEKDYQLLQRLLTTRKWEQADTATWNLIRHLLGKPANSYLFSSNLEKIPCVDLARIDRLWLQASMERFGFTTQARIYRVVGEDYGAFCDRVGWARDNRGDSSQSWRFEAGAPLGHLPSRLYITGQQWYRHMAVMSARLEECQLLPARPSK